MSATVVNDIQELIALSTNLVTSANQIEDSLNNLKSIVKKAHDYDGIDVTTAGNILKNNLITLSNDLKNATKNIESYTAGLETLDDDDFTNQADIFSLRGVAANVTEFFTEDIPTAVSTGVTTVTTKVEKVVDNVTDVITAPFKDSPEKDNASNENNTVQ